MNHEFWQDAWKNGSTSFTQKKPNYMLVHNFAALNTPKNGRVLVALCGKSIDMLWFAEQQLDVVGIELVESAITQFFTENNLEFTITPHPTTPNLTCYKSEHAGRTIEIWLGDIFDVTAEDIGKVDAIYDRGALIALPDVAPEHLRTRYTQQLVSLSGGASQFLLSFAYDDDKKIEAEQVGDIPPFLITDEMLSQYYNEHYDITILVREKADVVSAAGDSGYRLAYALMAKT